MQGYSGNWAGQASPPAPADPDATPTDGFYSATLLGPWAPGDTVLRVRIERLERCTALPADTCFVSDDPDELGIDPTWSLDVDVPLDANTRVVVAGFDCPDPAPTTDPNTGAEIDQQNRLGSGADLKELFEAYTADYATAIVPPLEAGVDLYAEPDEYAGTPDDGFVTATEACPNTENALGWGPLRYVHGAAPVLLVHSVVDWEGLQFDATDLVVLTGVWFDRGTPTYTFYAGFYS